MSDGFRIDSHKLIYHPERVAAWLEAGADWNRAKKVYPIYLELSPTGACNHRCQFCAMDFIEYQPNALRMDTMSRTLPQLASLGVKSIMFAGEGEPLIFDEIADLAKLTRRFNIDIAFTTNGVLLSPDLAQDLLPLTSWIKVSLDAGTPSTYSLIHRTKASDFHKVLQNLKFAIHYRNTHKLSCTIGGQLLLLPENAHEVEQLGILCRDELELDYLVIKPHSQHPFSKNHKHQQIDYTSIASKAKRCVRLSTDKFKIIYREETIRGYSDFHSRPSACNAVPFFWAYIMSNHDVYACSAFLGDERFYLGNLLEESWKEIWEGTRRKTIFEMMRTCFDTSECRVNCRMRFINEYLWQLQNPHAHVNFI